jgi:hypothetical protein
MLVMCKAPAVIVVGPLLTMLVRGALPGQITHNTQVG